MKTIITEREVRELAEDAGLRVAAIDRRKSGRFRITLDDGRTLSAPSHVRDVHSVENWKAFARHMAATAKPR